MTGAWIAVGVLAYFAVGVWCARDVGRAIRRDFPEQPIEASDVFSVLFFGFLFWPFGWPTGRLTFDPPKCGVGSRVVTFLFGPDEDRGSVPLADLRPALLLVAVLGVGPLLVVGCLPGLLWLVAVVWSGGAS